MVANTQTTIWHRLIETEKPDLLPEAARTILNWDFRRQDHERMAELAAKAQEGTLLPDEQVEAEEYRRAADFLAMLQSKARRSLQHHGVHAG